MQRDTMPILASALITPIRAKGRLKFLLLYLTLAGGQYYTTGSPFDRHTVLPADR